MAKINNKDMMFIWAYLRLGAYLEVMHTLEYVFKHPKHITKFNHRGLEEYLAEYYGLPKP